MKIEKLRKLGYENHVFLSDFLLLSWSPRRTESDFASTSSSSSKTQWAAVTTQVLPICRE